MIGINKRGIIVQEREKYLLRELAVMRLVDLEQAKCVAGFRSDTRAYTRLHALTDAGLMRRFFLGTEGSGQKVLYAHSVRGANLVQVPYRGPRRQAEKSLVADYFVIHQLHINRLYCVLKYQPIPVLDAKFLRWESFYEPIDGSKLLIPDGYVEVATRERTVSAFLEVDLGHERGGVWPKKVTNYLRYAASGEFPKRFSQPQFRVLVVTNSDRRMQSLRAVTLKLTSKIFWFTTFDDIASDGFWAPIWFRPEGDAALPLL
jgi:hypothetical protein